MEERIKELMNNGEPYMQVLLIVCAENPEVDEVHIKNLLNLEIKKLDNKMSVQQKKLF